MTTKTINERFLLSNYILYNFEASLKSKEFPRKDTELTVFLFFF